MTLVPAEQVPLAPLTTLGVGGNARFYLELESDEHVREALGWAAERALAVEILGGGSNVVIADRGLDALVVRLRSSRIAPLDDELVDVDAGVRWDALVAWSVAADRAGLECLSGIPGDVGAAPIQNVGAYGQDVAEALVAVEAIDRRTAEPTTFDHHACELRYRDSVFKNAAADRYLVTRVRFRLRRGAAPKIAYAELDRAMAGRPHTLAEVRQTVIALRRGKSMVLDESDENRRSAGSFFVNPVVGADAIEAVRACAARLAPGERMPEHPAPDHAALDRGAGVKLSAAWLIERAGLAKGTARGRVGISTRHSLALVNRGGATAAELVAFAAEVRERVHEAFGVVLVPEPRLLGFTPEEAATLLGGVGGRRARG
jgi:UDP-N-acetylmuramate dehydrogenase